MTRFLLALLALCLALPATAMPSCAAPVSTAAAMAMAMDGMPPMSHHHDANASQHLCLGCAVAGDWLHPRVIAPFPLATTTPAWAEPRLLPRAPAGPPLPPPRRG